MIVSIHQPDYLPWLGYLNKIKLADVFVLLDLATYSRGGFHNRNKIKTSQGWSYLTIPIEREYCFKSFVNVPLPKDSKWAQKHLNALQINYSQAKFWDENKEFFSDLYLKKIFEFSSLSSVNSYIIKYLCEKFGLTTKIVFASELLGKSEMKSTDLLVEITKAVGGSVYLSGPSGREYLEPNKFVKAGVEVIFQEFKMTPYPQLFGDFIPGLSSIDLLFNCGSEGSKYLL